MAAAVPVVPPLTAPYVHARGSCAHNAGFAKATCAAAAVAGFANAAMVRVQCQIYSSMGKTVCVSFTSFEGELLARKPAIRRGWKPIDDASSESKRCFMTARSVVAQDPEHMPMSTVDQKQTEAGCSFQRDAQKMSSSNAYQCLMKHKKRERIRYG